MELQSKFSCPGEIRAFASQVFGQNGPQPSKNSEGQQT